MSAIQFAIALFALLAAAGPAEAAAPDRPNVVVILVDDLGATDLGCYGNTFHETPHTDRLARDGMRFTAGYSACTVCSPTRAALLTGQHPARLHITDWIAGHRRPFARLRVPDWTMHLPTETFNLARAFRAAGYATASVGKWHLGGPDSYPERQGFDENIGGTDRGSPRGYLPPFQIPTLPDRPSDAFLTDRLTDEAVGFIAENRNRPFFLYLPHYAVHTPLGGKPEVVEKYRAKAERQGIKRNPTYAALLESVDDGVGAIRDLLADLGIDSRTIIVFASDNCGLLPLTTNPPFRAGKGSAYEGGVRVPWIVRWPGVTRPGGEDASPIISNDLLPTLAEACGLAVPPAHTVDGVSLAPLLRGTGGLGRDALFWHYPHYHPGGATPHSAARFGDWKLIEFFEDDRVELYNLKEDVGEAKDLAAADPGFTAKLRGRMRAWRAAVGAQLPTANPDHDPTRDMARPRKE